MAGHEITLWIDERWYRALEKYLKDESLQDKLEEYLDQLVNQLPEREYTRISHEIWQEQQQMKQEQESARRFSVFRVTETGKADLFLVEGNIDMMIVAKNLRTYLSKDPITPPDRFAAAYPSRTAITEKEFAGHAMERAENTGRVVGAYDINMDRGEFTTLHTAQGWETYRIKDVSTAAYFAMRKDIESWNNRWIRFMEKLVGKQINSTAECTYLHGERSLEPKDISFSEDIVQNDFMLEFYLDIAFDADRVFGTNVCTTENDNYLNLYANYNLEEGWVDDDLTVVLVRSDGSDIELRYKLSVEEKAAMIPKMDAYCKCRLGLSLTIAVSSISVSRHTVTRSSLSRHSSLPWIFKCEWQLKYPLVAPVSPRVRSLASWWYPCPPGRQTPICAGF